MESGLSAGKISKHDREKKFLLAIETEGADCLSLLERTVRENETRAEGWASAQVLCSAAGQHAQQGGQVAKPARC